MPVQRDTPDTLTGPQGLVAVINGNASGVADAERVLAEVTANLGEWGAVEGRVTRTGLELRHALEDSGGRRVVLVGGDGTLHAAANLSVPLPELALIPTGRANNVARALGIPQSIDQAARVAATSPALPVDVLAVESGDTRIRCLEALSAGLQADARAAYDRRNSADLGAGARALAGALRRYRPHRVQLDADGERAYEGDAAQVFLSNMPLFGFGFRVAPQADPADGMLDALVLRARSRAEAVRLLLATYRGRHLESAAATVRRARRAVLRSPLPLVCDGTPLGTASADVSVERGRLRIAAPWKR